MGDKTGIQWTDATWNPIAGCSVLSPACTNCYAMAQAARIQRMAAGADRKRAFDGKVAAQRPTHYAGTTQEVNGKAVWTGKIVEAPEHIFTLPLRWQKPRWVFVNSMSDVGHENVADSTLDRIFAVMALCERHTFQPLTKRPARVLEYLGGANARVAQAVYDMAKVNQPIEHLGLLFSPHRSPCLSIEAWPLRNVILGVTVEDQPRADERREAMRALAAMGWRIFVSYEPALGPVDFKGWEFVSQIIVGGESGPDARPMHPEWVRATLAFCRAHGIAFFFKQWGEWGLIYDRDRDDPDWRNCPKAKDSSERYVNLVGGHGFHGDRVVFMRRVGKKRAGRLLDGKEYSEFPEAR